MATHSSILAWEIAWTEEPGGLESMGSPSVRHDIIHAHAQTHTYTFGCLILFICITFIKVHNC